MGFGRRWGSVFVASVLDGGHQGIGCGKGGHRPFF